jgi:chromosome segregation ATPase
MEEAAGVFLEMEKLRAQSQALEKELEECTSEVLKTENVISETEPLVIRQREEVKGLRSRLQELQERNKEIIRLKAEKPVVEKEIADGQAAYESKMSDIQRLQSQLEEKSVTLTKLENENKAKRKQYEQIESETGRLDQAIAQYAAALETHAQLAGKKDALVSEMHEAFLREAELETGMTRLGHIMRTLAKNVESMI